MAKRKRKRKTKPSIPRGVWHRKPQTQIAPNSKAKQSRKKCREKIELED